MMRLLSAIAILWYVTLINCDNTSTTEKWTGKYFPVNPDEKEKNDLKDDWTGKWFPVKPTGSYAAKLHQRPDSEVKPVKDTSEQDTKANPKESIVHHRPDSDNNEELPRTPVDENGDEKEEKWRGKWFPNPPHAEEAAEKKTLDLLKIFDSMSDSEDVTPSLSQYPTFEANKIDSQSNLNKNYTQDIVMGETSECDDAKKNLGVDFDPENSVHKLMYTCLEQIYRPDVDQEPLITLYDTPARYVPIHRCMNVSLEYEERIPVFGPHRPLWLAFGEYTYAPVQRWLHNIEHGSIIMLYHPCANRDQVYKLKTLLTNCLYRHVITPYLLLTQERPLALAGWGASLEMSVVDNTTVINFIKQYAKTGPEHTYRNGQYNHLLINPASIVSDFSDTDVCPYSKTHSDEILKSNRLF